METAIVLLVVVVMLLWIVPVALAVGAHLWALLHDPKGMVTIGVLALFCALICAYWRLCPDY